MSGPRFYKRPGGGVGITDGSAPVLEIARDGSLLLPNGDPAGGSSLTDWETDADGNLVNTGTGALLVGTLGRPISVLGKFVEGGPANLAEATLFRVSSPNWSGDPDAPQDLFEIDDNDGDAALIGLRLAFKDTADKSVLGRLIMGTASMQLSVLDHAALETIFQYSAGAVTLGNTGTPGTVVFEATALTFGEHWSLNSGGNLINDGGFGLDLGLGLMTLGQRADPGSVNDGTVALYCKDVGGKTALMARFNTGSVQQIAIEP